MELLSGGEMIMRALEEEQVKMIFGYPGGAVLHIYDALYQQDAVEHILVRHEQAAVHAADGFSRSTGEVGVALVTSGPGQQTQSPVSRPLIWIRYLWSSSQETSQAT